MAALSVDGTPMPALPNSADQINYDNTTSGLSATTVKGAVDELASEKQDKSDNSLQTTDKTIVGGINELKSGLNNLNNKFSSVTIEGTTETNGVLTPVTSISASDYIVLSCVASNSNIAIPFVAGSDGTIRFMVVNTNLQPLNGVAVTVVANLMLIS